MGLFRKKEMTERKDGHTASDIGRKAGMSGKAVNKELKKLGYLDGEPGRWSPTEKGKKHSKELVGSNEDFSYGYTIWDDKARKDVLSSNKDKVKAMKKAEKEAKKIMKGFKP